MAEDIRDRLSINQKELLSLNFVRSSPPYVLRRHYRQGLRSHIMEILNPSDVERERVGEIVDGIRWFPKAIPNKMFRIFRTRLKTLDSALAEIERVKIVERYLAPDFMATSAECIVDYQRPEGHDLLLCGFQEYVEGEVLDPWTILKTGEVLPSLYEALVGDENGCFIPKTDWIETARQRGTCFVNRIKRMVTESGHIPDLAGTGNLIITRTGTFLLVDINNISPVNFDTSIFIDEKGYPVCDKSIEALSLIEHKILGKPADMNEEIYRCFLDADRRELLKALEQRFWQKSGNKITSE